MLYLIASVLLSVSLMGPQVIQNDSLKAKPMDISLKRLIEDVVQKSEKSVDDEKIEFDGLLIDDTRTKAGKDFYDSFYSSWEAPPEAKNYTITVSEKPFRFISTLITISINENMVYQSILQPRQDIIENQAMDAIVTTQEYLANYEEIMKQLNGEDMSGTGIY